MGTKIRKKTNNHLKKICKDITGDVLSIGSGNDSDGFKDNYRNYFLSASSYTTSDQNTKNGNDLILDVTNMKEIENNKFDCIFCLFVLEHVYEFQKAFDEIKRILKKDGILILGLPFVHELHMIPNDYWRFTEFSIKMILQNDYKIDLLYELIDNNRNESIYLVKATKY
jgi:ubiquinone/menaquinone biosynthesis C-methylase UbiE